MDTNTSGEELYTKARKPYTITKQRERWTEDEHDKFLEALRLYGRAWQRIEEHVGTKTAVQIRSHAQKFFTKLEKEAEAKGIQALDIEIPPPRPKRKPNTPYPRKPGNNGASSSQVTPGNGDTFMESEQSLRKKQASADDGTSKNSNVDNMDQDIVSQDFMFRPMGDRVKHPATTTSSATTTSQRAFPACHSQDDYRSFLQISSTFSNLVMSTLLQNPAAHAAATFAASVWPYANSGDPSAQTSSPPSIAAIAAATVATATAWWASHGLLPLCATAPITCLPLPTVAVPTPAMNKMDTVENGQVHLEKQSADLQDRKFPASSSDDSEETGVTKLYPDSKTNGDKEEVVVAAALHDSNATTQNKKPVDRSSCGSNTPSGSDAETDALDKMEKDKEETDANQPDVTELNNRRSKLRDNNNQTTDSWKEVSQGGRIAFQALFARERLPQSFSPPQVSENVNGKQSNNASVPLAPNFKIQDSCDADQESVVMIGVGPGKRQTGFKPYKRCSMKVKESQVGNSNNQSDEKVCKRLRLEEEAST